MKKELHLTNDVSQVVALGEWIERLGEELALNPADVFQLNLALEEAVVNVMNYAYPGQTDMPIVLSVSADEGADGIVFRLTDNGVPFDPTQAEMPDVTLSAEERNIGGLGIFLVEQLMNRVAYEREGESNVLTMEWKRKSD
ncbi:MAG: ATP-binding protein [Prevotella sp.]|nr:ATP-binding protein [Prevotella sp.]